MGITSTRHRGKGIAYCIITKDLVEFLTGNAHNDNEVKS